MADLDDVADRWLRAFNDHDEEGMRASPLQMRG
jgi:hypothetical protein